MELHGKQLIGFELADGGGSSFRALDPTTGETLAPDYRDADRGEVDAAAELAGSAADALRRLEPRRRAAFLEAVGEELEKLGDELIERSGRETALPEARLVGERGRTVQQLRMFAELVREGSWVDARIERALPDRQPLPRPDLRRMLVPLGPVAVFGASNFPLAFSVAGGDTASAWAAGCPVVVKAHPAHPGTGELAGRAVVAAARRTGMPAGVFSMVHGSSHRVGEELVKHPAIRAVGFTGSLRGGRALFDLAARRPEPIPVCAEMGSSNPVFVLPGAMAERGERIAEGLVGSVTLGGGQFCTNPGLTVVIGDAAAARFEEAARQRFVAAPACTLVHPSIKTGYEAALAEVTAIAGLAVLARSQAAGPLPATEARAVLLHTDAETFLAHQRLGEEIYGPATVVVRCADREQLLEVARSLHGHLTATLHGSAWDLEEFAALTDILQTKAGRLIFNGFPTGVEVGSAMQHGGPYPATTDSRATSVGTAAILRFARPVCWQDFPAAALPAELRDDNPMGIWRQVDGRPTREPISVP